jgi:hypothetical protein
MANRAGYCQGTQPGYDRGLKNFRSPPKRFGDQLGALPPNPGSGGTAKAGALVTRWHAQDSRRLLSLASKQPNLTLFDFGAARARSDPWVLNPLVDWARSFLLSDAYLASCAVNTLTCRIGGCLVQPSQRTTSSKRKRIQSDHSARDPLTQQKWQLRCSTKDEKPLTPLFGSLTHTIGGSHLRGDRVLRCGALGLRSARRSDPTRL